MKKLTGVVSILAVLILGGYYGMGVLTERIIKNNIRMINQPNELVAHVEDYDRGLFSSDAKIKWHLHIPERTLSDDHGNSQTIGAQDYEMLMPIKIHHGPIIYSDHQLRLGMGYAKTAFSLPEQYKQQFDEAFSKDSTKPQLDLSIFVNYLAQSTLELVLPTFHLTSKDGTGHFNWKGMQSNTKMSSNLDKVDGNIVVDGLSMKKEDIKVLLDKVTTNFNLHKTYTGLYLGDAQFALPQFDVMVKDQKTFEITDLKAHSDSDIKDKLFTTHLDLTVKTVIASGLTYGPGELQIALKNLDADVLADINRQVKAAQNGTDDERQRAMIALLPEIPKLFSQGAEFEISKLSVKISEGLIEGNLLLLLPKGNHNNPFELLQKIQGNAKLKMPQVIVKEFVHQTLLQQMAKQPDMQQALIQQMQKDQNGTAQTVQPALTQDQLAIMQTNKQISTMEQNGLLVAQGSDYLTEVKLEQGRFTVNGKPFDPSMLK